MFSYWQPWIMYKVLMVFPTLGSSTRQEEHPPQASSHLPGQHSGSHQLHRQEDLGHPGAHVHPSTGRQEDPALPCRLSLFLQSKSAMISPPRYRGVLV